MEKRIRFGNVGESIGTGCVLAVESLGAVTRIDEAVFSQ